MILHDPHRHELVVRSAEPDELDAWVLASAPRAVAYATSLLRDRDQAEDVVQDCYCRLLAHSARYDLPNDGLRLLLKAISHACINLRTRRHGGFSLFSREGRPLELADPSVPDPRGLLLDRELAEVIDRGLATLPVRQRAAIELKSQGHSLAEIAEILEVHANHVGVLVHRGRAALRTILAPYLRGREFMNSDLPTSPDVEILVHAYLRDQEQTVDPQRILVGVRSRRARRAAPRSFRRVAIARRWALAASAVVLLLGFAWSFRQTSAHADAVRLVREARATLATTPRDRSYRIGITLAPGSAERYPHLAALAGFECRLWTRADRFWVEGKRDSQVWTLGRDEHRHVWIAPEAGLGIDFQPEELPKPLDEALNLYHFDLDATLQVLATDFDTTLLPDTSDSGSPNVIRIGGTPRSDHPRPRLQKITVEIDQRTKVVRQVVLARVRDGRPVADVVFTFDPSGVQPDLAYRLAGHLDPDAPIYTDDQRLRRRHALIRFFGSLLLPQGE